MPRNTRARPHPRWQRRPEARPEEILDAAHAVFGAQGFARTKLEDIARHAGVSKGTLYLYFESKEALFRDMVRAKLVPIIAAAEETIRSHEGDSEALLRKLILGMWDTMRRREVAQISRLVQSELRSFPELAQFYFDEVILRARHMIDAALERGVASGEFRPEARRFAARGIPQMLAYAAQTQCFFHSYDSDALTDEQVVEGTLDLSLKGILARSGA